MSCPYCGGKLEGDGFAEVVHCENVDLFELPFGLPEPDAPPVYCNYPNNEEE